MREQEETLSPGDRLRDAIEARQWTQTDFAEIIGRPLQAVNEIIAGRRAITPETALEFEAALGRPTAVEWLQWEAEYQLSQTPARSDHAIRERASQYTRGPVRDMIKRGWIPQPSNEEDLKLVLDRFFAGCDDAPGGTVAAAARKTYAGWTPAEMAWLCKGKQLARTRNVSQFTEDSVRNARERLRSLQQDPSSLAQVAEILAQVGIKFVVVQTLAGAKIDGATCWEPDGTPVIILAIRYDRIDNFLFVLYHELAHVEAGDGKEGDPPLDRDLEATLVRQDENPVEQQANARASRDLVPTVALEHFMGEVRPFYSRVRVERFARSVGVHPGIVVGQLHHRGEIPYANLRKLLVPVRETVVASVFTDGWGRTPDVVGGRRS
jgi:HTH-type transcriptional regulator / antitoxin HigA